MGAGPLAFLPAIFSVGSKLLGGTAQAAGGGGGGGTPFDAISNPKMAAPPPEKNPNFHSNEQAALIPGLPEKNPAFHDEPQPFQGLTGKPITKEDEAGRGASVIKSKPSLFAGDNPEKGNNERFAEAGYTLDSSTGQDVTGQPKPVKAATVVKGPTGSPKGLFDDVAAATDEDTPVEPTFKRTPKTTAPVQAATPNISPAADDSSEDSDTTVGNGFVRSLFGDQAGDFLGNLNDKLGDSATNPLFQTGMGLLASGHDGSNPWTNIQKSLGAIPGLQIAAQNADLNVNQDRRAQTESEAKAKETSREQELMALLAAIGAGQGGGGQPRGGQVASGGARVIR